MPKPQCADDARRRKRWNTTSPHAYGTVGHTLDSSIPSRTTKINHYAENQKMLQPSCHHTTHSTIHRRDRSLPTSRAPDTRPSHRQHPPPITRQYPFPPSRLTFLSFPSSCLLPLCSYVTMPPFSFSIDQARTPLPKLPLNVPHHKAFSYLSRASQTLCPCRFPHPPHS